MSKIQKTENVSDPILYQNFFGYDLSNINIEKTQFWNKLITYLSNENIHLGHWLFRKGDLTDNDTAKALLEYIAERINIAPDGQDIIDIIRNNKPNPPQADMFWNDSANALIKYVLMNFDNEYNTEIGQKIIVDDENEFDVNAIKNGNAGNSFEPDAETNPNHHWVESWTNAKGKTYSQVRGNDKKLNALTNDSNLDSTNAESNVIKLLLPRYQRHVEIEDLDRNFWVIGQSLAGISAFLFSKSSPFLKTFENILREIYNLWENVLYLWLAFAISMQDKKYYSQVHEEVLYISASSLETNFKYDDFENSDLVIDGINFNFDDIKTKIIKKINYLKAKYPECHLCIIPVVRADGYESNYYSTEYYPGAFIYNRNNPNTSINSDGWEIIEFKGSNDSSTGYYYGVISFKPYEYINDNITYQGIQLPNNTNIGFTNNNFNDIYYINGPVNALYNSSAAHQTINNIEYLNYLGIEKSSMTCYSLFRTYCHPKTGTSHIFKYDQENDIFRFDNLVIDIIDMATYVKTNGNKEQSLYCTIKWYMNSSGNLLQYSKEINQNYNAPESILKTIIINPTSLHSWPLQEYTDNDFTGVSSVYMIQLDDEHGKITQESSFYCGEILSTLTGFFTEHYEE